MSTFIINREYKDRLFRLLFGDEANKANVLSLYNALNNTNYTNVDDFEITTLEDAIYMHMKNDVSILIDSYLTLWEQQSTFNPNMPVRGLMYYGKLYNAYIKRYGLDIYHSSLAKIPTPQYVVFYNGNDDKESIIKLRLSEAFIHKDDNHEFEWTATMLNLNVGKNEELLSKCKVLADYMTLLNKIRFYLKQNEMIENAVDLAVTECIEEDVLADFLQKHRGEVMSTCITEFNEEVYQKSLLEEGREEERIRFVKKALAKNMLIEEMADYLELQVEEVQTLIEKIKNIV